MPWKYRPNHPLANENGMVDTAYLSDEPRAVSKLSRPYVVSDSLGGEVKHLATGKYLDSKSAHRKLNKQLGLVELGNDNKAVAPKETTRAVDKRKRRNDIGKAINQLRNGRRV